MKLTIKIYKNINKFLIYSGKNLVIRILEKEFFTRNFHISIIEIKKKFKVRLFHIKFLYYF